MPSSSLAASGTSSLTIRAFYCPGGLSPKGLPDGDCEPQAGITYWTDQTGGKTIGADGRVTFTGLAATVSWYRDNEEWWRPLVFDVD